MKFTLSWLKEHLDTAADAPEIAETATNIGLEVESIEDKARSLAPFTVARVVSAVPHPNADKLRLCMVDTGKGTVQVVCGAPNARTGLVGVFAAPGTYIPGSKFTLTPAKIRGVESQGMLCSERELELSKSMTASSSFPPIQRSAVPRPLPWAWAIPSSMSPSRPIAEIAQASLE